MGAVTMYLRPEHQAAIDSRCRPAKKIHNGARRHGTRSAGLTEILSRYDALLTLGRNTILARQNLSSRELAALANVNQNIDYSKGNILSFATNVYRALDGSNVAFLWQIDQMALLEKIVEFTPLEVYALIDAIQRFWLAIDTPDEYPVSELLTRTTA